MRETDAPKEWGLFGLVSLPLGVGSLFPPGLYGLFMGVAAVLLAVWGSRRQEKLTLPGMILGGVAVIFFNLNSLGIVKSPLKQDMGHLVHALTYSNRAYEALGKGKSGKPQEGQPDPVVQYLELALGRAGRVHTDTVDSRVPGFAAAFKDQYVTGLQLLMKGRKESDLVNSLKGGMLLDKWGKWYMANRDKLKGLKDRSPSLAAFVKRQFEGP